MEKTMNYNSEFWTYCGIKIPINIKAVPCIDGVNTHYINGFQTQLFGSSDKHLTLEEYQNKYSIAKSNGELFWKE